MAPPTVESSNTRFFVLLMLGAIALITWYVLRGSWSLPSAGFSMPAFDPVWIILPLVLGSFVYKAIKTSTLAETSGEPTEEPSSTEDTRSSYRSEEKPVTDEPQRWEDMPARSRAQIIGWVAIVLGFLFAPIGAIIGLILLRTYRNSDSMIVTVARVLLVLNLVFSIALFAPLLWLAFASYP